MKSANGEVHPLPLRWLLLVDVLVIVLFVSLAAVTLKASRESYHQRALTAGENLAQGLQQNIAAELTRVDTAMRSVIQEMRRSRSGEGFDAALTNTMLAEQMALVPELQGLRIADADGVVRFGSAVPTLAPLEIKSRAFFVRARDDVSGRLVISEPLVSRISHQQVIALARRFDNADGSFGGVIYGVLDIAHLAQQLASVDVGSEGAVSLRFLDLTLIARQVAGRPETEPPASDNVSPALRQAVAARPDRGVVVTRAPLDQVERIGAYRQVEGYPLLVLVGLGTQEYALTWRTQLSQVAGLVTAAALVLAFSSVAVYRAWRRERAAAAALAHEARRHQALLHTASDGIHVLDRTGQLVELSASFAAMLGYSPEQMRGRHVADWDAALPEQNIAQFLATADLRELRKFETRHRRADGSSIDVEVSSVAVSIEGEELIYCSSRDITERKTLATRLANSAAEIRDLYDNAPCGYYSLDADGYFLHVNTTVASWLGCTPQALIGQRQISEFLTDEGRAQFKRLFPQVKANQAVSGLVLDLVAPGMPARQVSLSATAVTDAQGAFLMTRTVIYDITELKATKERLQHVLREQQLMLDNELIGIVKLRDQKVVWRNQAMQTIFGYAPQDVEGASLMQFHVNEEAYHTLRARALTALRAGERFRAQFQVRHKLGHLIWVDAHGVMLDHALEESMWMLADITPLKASQERVEHMAFHDALTGLPNRSSLVSRITPAMAMATRYHQRLGLCYLDLDGFKQVNDVHGHAAGDELLKTMAQRLQATVRGNDTVCRLGGDEFVILLAHLESADEHLTVLRRVVALIESPVQLSNGIEVAVSASIGVAFYPEHGQDLQSLLGNADQAMYAAKKTDERVRVFEPPAAPRG
ncbi:diguanylate cyclase domain-containing protein [Variovorax sp. HJSM1_2]|uniref:sensor domain-containing diguanylate cyclase n=1 Tax=Variovorax sp. HJSM1_2 TaxID=3366263 RepID=UPI003BCA900D